MKIIPFTILAICVSSSYAALNGYSCTSRANCINNETIAWDATQQWEMFTTSKHCNGPKCDAYFNQECLSTDINCHMMKSNVEKNWRSASVHWGEAINIGTIQRPFWTVNGTCHNKTEKGWHLQTDSLVTTCQIYDGWWDFKPPKQEVEKTNDVNTSKLPNSPYGIKIVPSSELPKSNDPKPNSKGYIESDSTYPSYLLNLQEKQRKRWIDPKDEYDSNNGEIKSDHNHIKKNFSFKGFALPNLEIIGYVGEGSHIKTGEWNGMNVYFSTDIVTCNLTIDNYSVNSGLSIPKESIKYLVNNKPSISSIKGSEKNGFIYYIGWVRLKEEMGYDLNCANLKYDPSIMGKVVEYANTIDKQL